MPCSARAVLFAASSALSLASRAEIFSWQCQQSYTTNEIRVATGMTAAPAVCKLSFHVLIFMHIYGLHTSSMLLFFSRAVTPRDPFQRDRITCEPPQTAAYAAACPFIRSRTTQPIFHTCFLYFATSPQGIPASTLTHLN